MKLYSNRKWNIKEDKDIKKIKEWLIKNGGREEKVNNKWEMWRIKFMDATVTMYKGKDKNTLFITDSDYEETLKFHEFVDSLIGSTFIQPNNREFLIGFDEVGKGEVIGPVILVGVLIPSDLFTELERVCGVADTKIKHSIKYWEDLYRKIDFFKQKGLQCFVEKIPPWDFDKYNINQLMDLTYQRILNNLVQKVDLTKTRIVIDDYGIGVRLNKYLNILNKSGAGIIKINQADKKYLECKLASLIAKWVQVKVIEAIRKDPEFQIPGYDLGSGNAGDEKTLAWLKEWWNKNKKWPWFVKQSFKTIAEIESRECYKKQKVPPLNENILSQEFREKFYSGKLDTSSLAFVCNKCGQIIRSLKLKPINYKTTAVCINCDSPIEDAGPVLRYYCGRILPDSSVILRGFLSKDLNYYKFFENFIFLLHPIVKKECDTAGGKKELERLGHYDSIGMIRLEEVEQLTNLDGEDSLSRDNVILEDAKKYNAIIITADNGMKGVARSKNLFVLKI